MKLLDFARASPQITLDGNRKEKGKEKETDNERPCTRSTQNLVHFLVGRKADRWEARLRRAPSAAARKERERTGIGNGDGGGAPEVACARHSIGPLVEAVEGVGGVRLESVREVAQAGALNRRAVRQSGPARIVERQLDRRLAGAAPSDAPRGALRQVFSEESCQEQERN